MISMTGFANREWAAADISLSVEIKGYNSRFMEMHVNAPPWISRYEPKIRELVGAVCGRGKVDIAVRIRENNMPISVSVNANAASAYMQAINGLAGELGIEEKASLSLLIGMDGVLDIEKNRDEQRYWNMLEPVLKEAINIFQEERVREGKQTQDNILNFIDKMESYLKIIQAYIPDIEKSIKDNIKARFKELVDNEIDDNRILAETAMLLIKYTISEEIFRLSSHLGEFRAEAARNERPGKKLDFLCQEINREVNTIGSKSTVLEVSRAVVEMKESLENIREQLRNVE